MLDQFYHIAVENSHLKQIKSLMGEGYHQEALRQLQQFEQGKLSMKENFEKLFLLVDNYIAIGDFSNALLLLKEIEPQELEEECSKLELFSYKLSHIKALLYAGQFEQSEEWWEQAWRLKEDFLKEIKSKEQEIISQQMEAELLFIKGKIAYFKGNVENAINYFEAALESSQKIDFKILQFHILNGKAMTYYQKGDLEEALSLFKKGIELVELIKNKFLAVRIIGNMGLVYYDLGLVEEAIEHHKGALHLAEEISDLAGVAIN